MSGRKGIILGAAGLAALAGSTVPAQAQYYPPPQQQNPGGFVGALINSYQYGRYPYGNNGYNQYGNQRYGIDRCARAVDCFLYQESPAGLFHRAS